VSYVLKKDGKYGKGRTRYEAEWVEDIQEARVFTRMGDAVNSRRHTFATKGRYYEATESEVEAIEIVPVRIVEEVG
jgi:hypothetical protein